MVIDLASHVDAYLADRAAEARYASFDYCYNHFQAAREHGESSSLASDAVMVLSCLHLGFYLASWGMMRGSSELLQRSVRVLIPVVQSIAAEPMATWSIDVSRAQTYATDVLGLCKRIRKAFPVQASDTLVTKTVLGVFGCVPAFDRYFRTGFNCQTLCASALDRIAKFYTDNAAQIDAFRVSTLDVNNGQQTQRFYPRGKLIDMIFFQAGGGSSQGDPLTSPSDR